MAETKQKADVSKLWIVKDYKSHNDQAEISDPEKILLCEWSREEDSTTPNDKFKDFLGIVYEHEGALAGHYALPLVIHTEVNGLVKKLMTFVEATVADKEQKEATKKLITRTVWDHFNEINKNVEISLERAKEVKNIR